MTAAIRDTATVFSREIAPLLRNPLGLVFAMAQPLVFLVLFGPLLGGTAGVSSEGSGGAPWQWFVPGILVMMAVFGTGAAGYGLLMEANSGSLERMLVTPLNRGAMLAGKTLKEVTGLLAQAVVIVVALLPFGLRLRPVGMLAALVLLAAAGVGMGALTVALAIALKRQQETFWGVQQVLLFPLVLLSGVLLPVDTAPGWLATLSRLNPVTYLVDAERALFAGDLADVAVLPGVLATAGLLAVGLWSGSRAMRTAAL
jgi:ABC-2 type transport system permease protein